MKGFYPKIIFEALNYKKDVLQKIIKENEIDLIYAGWSTGILPTIKVLQKLELDIPIIFRSLMYPAAISKNAVCIENMYCKRIIEKIEGRIHLTTSMYKYMSREFNLQQYGKDFVFMEYLSEKYFFRKRLPLLSDQDGEPHIVFLGSINFQEKHNDITNLIYELTKNKIHIHLMNPRSTLLIKENKYIHFFSPFSHEEILNGKLGTFLTQFDAAIVAYNNNYKQVIRFGNVIPNRFLFALTGGIPIVIPKDNNLISCEELIISNKIGFIYNTIDELVNKLKDEDLIYELRKNALKKSKTFHYEKHFNKLNRFIRGILNE
jgi:hypothetical protein